MDPAPAQRWRGAIDGASSAREDASMTFQKILIAVDESPVAAHAADVGSDFAHAVNGETAFVTVVDPGAAAGDGSGTAPSATLALLERDARRLLDERAQRSALTPIPLQFVAFGEAAAEIVRTAREWSADVIVIGTHGRAGVRHLLLGSVAEAVTRHAPCPVLLVRPPT
jgi:nucleotide-binding universal stress UspA family protein